MSIQITTPTDKLEAAIIEGMATAQMTDRAAFLDMVRRFRNGIYCAYHEAGAPYGYGNGWGCMRWVEEQINEMQVEALAYGEYSIGV